MPRTVAETIKEATREHLNSGGLLFSQCVTAVGWIGGTVPDCKGIVELSMAFTSPVNVQGLNKISSLITAI